MRGPIIEKYARDLRVAPNWLDTDAAREAFSWEAEGEELSGLPDAA